MAGFYVGQRVRLVRPVMWPELAGSECRIVALDVVGHGRTGDFIGHRLDLVLPNGMLGVARPGSIEPILYDGNQLVSWEECLWQPEGQAA